MSKKMSEINVYSALRTAIWTAQKNDKEDVVISIRVAIEMRDMIYKYLRAKMNEAKS